MCGIFGVINKNKKVTQDVLELGISLMKHRGPDSSGFWISSDQKIGLAHSRLSIVDLNERSNQPMMINNSTITVIFNGEIYNYKMLREKLSKKYKFRTTSDTEVLGYLYVEYGKKMLDLIEGMYAFAIYDKVKQTTFIARDIVGQKPLVYAANKNGFYFASEIPSLLSLEGTYLSGINQIDQPSIELYLTTNFSHIPAPFTIFKGIRKLEPSHYMIIKNGEIIEHKQYFRLKKTKHLSGNEYAFISNHVNNMKPSDISYSSFLSGGNDSALISSCLAQDNEVDVYTLKVTKIDSDYLRSREISKILKLNHHVIDSDHKAFLQSVESQIQVLGEPYFHITSVYADELLYEVKKKFKVIFNGAGGDEVYYGYNNLLFIGVDLLLRFKKLIPVSLLKAVIPKKYHFILTSTLKNIKLHNYMQNYQSASTLLREPKRQETEQYFSHINNFMQKIADIKNYVDLSYMTGLFIENLHSLTIQSDLIGMKNSMEVRCPFLEKEVIKRGFSLSLISKISFMHPREGKKILKKSLQQVLPRNIVYAKKIGFGTEFKHHDRIVILHKEQIKQKITNLASRKLFIRNQIIKLVTSSETIKNNFTLIMKLYALEIWFQEYIDKK